MPIWRPGGCLQRRQDQYDTVWCLGMLGRVRTPAQRVCRTGANMLALRHGQPRLGCVGQARNRRRRFQPAGTACCALDCAELHAENRPTWTSSPLSRSSPVTPTVLVTHASPHASRSGNISSLRRSRRKILLCLTPHSAWWATHTNRRSTARFHPSSARTTTVAIRTGWPRSTTCSLADHPIQLTVSAVQRLIVNPGSVGQPRTTTPGPPMFCWI
jgi:hypothetical protein